MSVLDAAAQASGTREIVFGWRGLSGAATLFPMHFPIGGITPENVASLAAAGAARAAVAAGVLSAPDPAAAALAILRALRAARGPE